MAHPFHPLLGQQFMLKARRQNWGEARVIYFDVAGKLRSMPLSWTDAAPMDQFVEVSSGHSWFRVDDLLELSMLLNTLEHERNPSAGSVK